MLLNAAMSACLTYNKTLQLKENNHAILGFMGCLIKLNICIDLKGGFSDYWWFNEPGGIKSQSKSKWKRFVIIGGCSEGHLRHLCAIERPSCPLYLCSRKQMLLLGLMPGSQQECAVEVLTDGLLSSFSSMGQVLQRPSPWATSRWPGPCGESWR